jgi:RNA polymerase sigma-70 factor (ECF subfamily)
MANPGGQAGGDDQLLERALGGDRAAIEQMLVRNLPNLEAYLRLHAGAAVRARESVSDLVQSVCVEVLRDLSRFEFRGEPQFRHWLCRQALHKIVNKQEFHAAGKRDYRREVRATRPSGADSTPSVLSCYASICTPSRVAAGREAMQRFEAAFDELPEDYRQAITMQRVVGLDYAEIAAAMGRSEGAVRNLVYRGLARLSALLDGG